jgi:hypothetical protein
VREHAVGVAGQQQQQVELLGREVGFCAAHAHRPRGGIDIQVADGDLFLRGLFAGGLTQVGAYAGEELGHREGLGDVVVGALVERGHLHRLLPAHGEDDDGCFGEPADGAGQFEAVHLRHG